MDRYIVVSSDGHAGPPADRYREYLDPEFRERFDEHQEAMSTFRASMQTESSKRFVEEWEEETGGDGGLRAGYDSAARNEILDTEGVCAEVLFPDADVLGTGRVASSPFGAGPGRRLAERSGRRRRRQPRPQPLARRLRERGAHPPHRHRGDPGHHPRHGPGADAGARGQGPRPQGDPHPHPLVRPTRLPRAPLRPALRAHRGARPRAPHPLRRRPGRLRLGLRHAPDLRQRGRVVGGPPAARADLGRRLRAVPHPRYSMAENGALVGARRHPQDGREVGRRPQHTEVRRRLPRDPRDEAQRVPQPQLLLRRVHARRRRHRAPQPHRGREHDVGQRPPAPGGHVPLHALLDPRAVPRRVRGGHATNPRPHRRRGVRARPRRAARPCRQDRPHRGRGPRRHTRRLGCRPASDHDHERGREQWRT